MSLFNSITASHYRNSGSYVAGRWSDLPTVLGVIKGSFQPAPGEVLATLPEGKRNTVTYVFYTKSAVQSAGIGQDTDTLIINSKTYNIIRIEPWQNNIISHYKIILQEEKES